MAQNFSPRKKRRKSILPPHQKNISQFFTPRSGISKEDVNFLVRPAKEPKFERNPPSREGTGPKENLGTASCRDQITFPLGNSGFITAARLYEQATKCSSVKKEQFLSFHSKSLNSPISWNSITSETSAAENSYSEDLAFSSGEKTTPVYGTTRVSIIAMSSSSSASSTSSTSESSSKVTGKVRRNRERKITNAKSRKVQKQCTIPVISLDSENGENSSDSDCSIVSVIRRKKAVQSEERNCEVEETACFTRKSANSRGPVKLESTSCRANSQTSSSSDWSSVRSSSSSSSSSVSTTCKSSRQNKQQSSVSSTKYGLVGGDITESDDESEDFNYCGTEFSQLPVEIMENIFCQLPIVDLMLNCVLVCRQWNNVISRDSFIPWKKRYFRLKSRDVQTEDEMIKLLDEKGLLELDSFPVNLLSFMKDFKRKGHPSLLDNLKTHSKFPLIETFLETITEKSNKNPSAWSVVALLTLVCQTVYDVQGIFRCMTNSTSCLVQDILECFYCLASVFYYLESQHRIGSGLHYRVFYSLYLYENAFEATCASINSVFDQNFTGQQSIMRYRSATDKLQLTHEQVRIIKHDVKDGELIKIVAFAGTGKTTTLVEYTKMRPMEKFLNVAYNKSIQEHALKTFPRNVESRTIHSLAFRGVGFRYKHKLSYGLRISTIMNALPPKSGYLHARRVEDTLKNFIASADTAVKSAHVPPVSRAVRDVSASEGSELFGDNGADLTYLNSEKYVQKVVSHAEGLWERMKDRGDKEFPITHDGYLKLYQLSRPLLSGFDCLLIDEAQDCTPAASDILLRQKCAKILVGDPHQQIYAFRGARNALQEVPSTHTFYLTQSFRFGPEIAYVASCMLDVLKGVRNKTIVGGAKKGSVLGESSGQVCVITRCNYTLFNEAVSVCCAQNNTKVGFVGGLKSLALDRIADIHKLFVSGANKRELGIIDPLVKKFGSFRELKKYAKVAPDPELLGKIKIVETHHVMLPQRIEKIKSKAVGNLQQADIIFSTAHKAKGLEFDTVRVTDDYLPGTDLGMSIHDHEEDEKNLVYVAVTRAKKCLQLNSTILGILGSRKEHFTKAVSPKDFSQPAVCAACKGEVHFSPPPHLAILKEPIILGGNLSLTGGILCTTCAINNVPHLGSLACVNRDSYPTSTESDSD